MQQAANDAAAGGGGGGDGDGGGGWGWFFAFSLLLFLLLLFWNASTSNERTTNAGSLARGGGRRTEKSGSGVEEVQ